jgi:hypothetical protein
MGADLRGFHGETDAEEAAAAEFALGRDCAAVVADDAVADRQAQAGPLPDRLGREERLEDVWQVLGTDAAAVVLDLNQDIVGRTSHPSFLLGADLDEAASGAGLNGVEHDVEKDLVELSRVTGDRRQLAEARPEFDIPLFRFVAEDVQGGAQGGVQIDLLELGLVEPGEVGEVADDLADALEPFERLVEQPRQGRLQKG